MDHEIDYPTTQFNKKKVALSTKNENLTIDLGLQSQFLKLIKQVLKW